MTLCITKFYQYQLSKYKAVNNRVVRGDNFHKSLRYALENVSVFIMAIFMHTPVLQVLHLGTVLNHLGMFECVLPPRQRSHSSFVSTKTATCGFGKTCF